MALVLTLAIIELALALVSVYLLALTIGAFRRRHYREPQTSPSKKFGVIIPAHDEELLLGRLLDSLEKIDYPAQLFDVFVVADNCTDATAALAYARGARVLERRDNLLTGKGHALRWALDILLGGERRYDAFVVFDADSLVSANFLRVMNDRLLSGSLVVQGYYNVANPDDSWSTALRYVALALVHYLRPLGKTFYGASAGLKGNGMCFATAVVEGRGWTTYALAEDVEYHLDLVSSGFKVDFAPNAVVRAEMPATLRSARSQNLRWERGRWDVVRTRVPGLIRTGIKRRSLAQLDAAAEQLVPPFTVPVLLAVLCLIAGVASGARLTAWVASAIIVCQALYVLVGLLLVRAPARVYISLLHAPVYIPWKTWLYLVSLVGADRRWVRTARE